MTTAPPERALVVRLSSIGDVIHTLPAYMALRAAWPSTLLGWAVEPAAAPLVQRLPGPLQVHVLDLQGGRQGWWRAPIRRRLRRGLASLRRAGYELAIDFQGLLKSAMVARLSRGEVMGFPAGVLRERLAARLYHRTPSPPPTAERHVIWRNLQLAEAAGAAAAEPRFPRLWDDTDATYVERRLARMGVRRFAVLHAGSNWLSKAWPPLHFAAVGETLVRSTDLSLLWIWGPGEESRAAALAVAVGPRSYPAFPTTLTQLAALLERADLFLGGDSAPLHLAVAAGTPVVGIYGPTDPRRTGPLDRRDRAVFNPLPCSFCHRRRCPLGTRQCLEELGPDAVAAAALARLREIPDVRCSSA